MLNSYNTNFDAPKEYFDNFSLFSDVPAEKYGNPKYYDCEDPNKSKKKEKFNCREMETNPSKDRAMHERDNPSF
jgi:hypothetical protein